jgi:hypothetical protein
VLIALAAIACGCSTTSTTATSTSAGPNARTRSATLACLLTFAPGTSDADSALVDKSLKTAEALASASHQTTRIVARNGSCVNVTADLVSSRADLWIVNGRVIKAVVEGPPFDTTSST